MARGAGGSWVGCDGKGAGEVVACRVPMVYSCLRAKKRSRDLTRRTNHSALVFGYTPRSPASRCALYPPSSLAPLFFFSCIFSSYLVSVRSRIHFLARKHEHSSILFGTKLPCNHRLCTRGGTELNKTDSKHTLNSVPWSLRRESYLSFHHIPQTKLPSGEKISSLVLLSPRFRLFQTLSG